MDMEDLRMFEEGDLLAIAVDKMGLLRTLTHNYVMENELTKEDIEGIEKICEGIADSIIGHNTYRVLLAFECVSEALFEHSMDEFRKETEGE